MNKKYVNFDSEESVTKYFKDIRKSSSLTSREEASLAKKIKKGDKKAIETLVNANLKFVISIAKEYQGQGLPLSDLISEGNYGLVKAATRFDHKRGFRFISYAVWWVKQSIIQSLNDNARMVRLPSNVISKISKLNKEMSKFEFLNEREADINELSDGETDLTFLKPISCVSLNRQINEDGDELVDLIVGEEAEEYELEVDERIKNQLNKTLSILDERERNIIQCYFGIDINCEAMTLEAIGEKYDLTKERIRQIKEKAIRKLRHNSHGLYDLINE